MARKSDEFFLELAKKAREDKRMLSRLIQEMEPQIEKVVSYYVRNVHSAESFRDDLRLSAMEGIVKAVERFDFSQKGFCSYAGKSIEMEVRAFLTDCIRTVRFPKYIVGAIRKLNAAEGYFSNLRQVPSEEDLMAMTGIASKTTFRSVVEARKIQDVYSLDYDYSKEEDGDGVLESFCASEEDTESALEENALEAELYGRVEKLSMKERFVIIHSYGLYGKKVLSNGEMAASLGVTTASVINYRNRALASLKTDLAKWSC